MSTTGNSGWLSTNNSAIKQRLNWEITTGSATSNTSTVKLSFFLKKDPSIQNQTTWSTDSRFVMTCDGQRYAISGVTMTVYADNVAYEMLSHTFTVSHNDDGTKSVTISIDGGLGGTSISYYSLSISKTITLPSIARRSTITSATDFDLSENASITFTPLSANFGYKIMFKLGSYSYTTDAITPGTTSQYVYVRNFTRPETWANQIPNSSYGTMSISLYTYSDSTCSTQIGSPHTVTCTVYVPVEYVPSIQSTTFTTYSNDRVVSDWGIIVDGYTHVVIEADAEGSCGSTIDGYEISGYISRYASGSPIDLDVLLDSSQQSSDDYVTTHLSVVAKDSRGRYSSEVSSGSLTVYNYNKPVISSYSISRDISDNTKVNVRINCEYSSCGGNNVSGAILTYKRSDSDSYTTYGTIHVNADVQLYDTFDDDSEYDFNIVVFDELTGSNSGIVLEYTLQTAEVLLDFRAGGHGLGIGRICATDSLEVGLPTRFYGDVYICNPSDGTEMSLSDYILSVVQ